MLKIGTYRVIVYTRNDARNEKYLEKKIIT